MAKTRYQLARIYSMKCLTKLQAGACWTGSYPAALHDTSCASKNLVGVHRMPPCHARYRGPASRVSSTIRRFSSTDRLAGLFRGRGLNGHLLGSVHLFPRGHFPMCPQRPSSLDTHISSRRFRPDAYFQRAHQHRPSSRPSMSQCHWRKAGHSHAILKRRSVFC